MDFAFIAVLVLGAFVGYKVGFSRGEKVNRPEGSGSGGAGRPREDVHER